MFQLIRILNFVFIAFFITFFAQIQISSDLDCDFSKNCHWRNFTFGQPESGWSLTNDAEKIDDRFPLSEGKKDNIFAHTTAPSGSGRREIWLVSDVINCQLGGAKIKFWFYFMGRTAKLEVCTRFPPGSMYMGNVHCYTPVSNARAQKWSLASVELPPMSQAMELILKAIYEAPYDLIALDDISYEAILCESISAGSSQGGGGQIDEIMETETQEIGQLMSSNLDPSFKNIRLKEFASNPKFPFEETRSSPIRQSILSEPTDLKIPFINSNCGLDCNFDTNHFCNFENFITNNTEIFSKSFYPWRLSNRPVSNPLTGIRQGSRDGGTFAYAGNAESGENIFVLKTLKYVMEKIKWDTILQFNYYLAGVRGRLRLCHLTNLTESASSKNNEADVEIQLAEFLNYNSIDYNSTLFQCSFQVSGANMQIDSRRWKTAQVDLPQSAQQMIFLADQLSKNYIIGLDEIHLMDKNGKNPANCDTNTILPTKDNFPTSINIEDYFH